MIIKSATFVKSSPTLKECPKTNLPEFAFVGRSNVGKSSLINMLTGYDKLAKTSGEPGKTQSINHFFINEEWYLVDLPGYGYAKVPQKLRDKWTESIRNYLIKRDNLLCVFVLLDVRLKPQTSDMEFMEFLGINGIPFSRIFTKIDKLGSGALSASLQNYDNEMLKKWEELPITFTTSASKRIGKDDVLNFIEDIINKSRF